MSRRLPPMNSLRFFDAAARAGGFLTAARELHVTPGAVSQQVKLLEAYLGTPLFDRRPRGVVLNEAGRAFHAPVAAALDHLALGAEAIGCAQSGRPLRITALPALAERWLVPRLAGFRARHPEIVIRLSADERMVDFAADPYDLGLRYGAGDDAGLDCMALFRDCLTPVCHPTLLGAANRLTDPAALLRWPMLADEQWMGDWPLWLRAAGSPELGAADGAWSQGPRFTLYSMAVDAALDGQGVLVGHTALLARELESGRLVAPFDLRVPAPGIHYLAIPPWAAERAEVVAFRTWIRAEAQAAA